MARADSIDRRDSDRNEAGRRSRAKGPRRTMVRMLDIPADRGALIFRRTSEARRENMPYGISYSFDMLLPLIKLRQRHYDIDLKEGAARYYFYIHKIAGWVIG